MMIRKKHIIYLIVFITSLSCKATDLISPDDNLNNLCKVWGFLKYFHPQVNDGSLNWDSVLVAKINNFDQNLTYIYFNKKINHLMNLAGEIKTTNVDNQKLKSNSALKWLLEDSFLNKKNKKLLTSLVNQYNKKENYYAQQPDSTSVVSFSNEIQYNEMLFPNKEYRLLALFRAWNAINYFSPHKKHMAINMNILLNQLIPEMKNANDTLAYHGILKKFSSALNDSHATLSLSRYLLSLYPFRTAAKTRYVEGQFVFIETDINNVIHKGDILVKVEKKDVHSLTDSLQRYWNASNEIVTMSAMNFFLLSGQSDILDIVVRRGNQLINLTISRSKNPQKPRTASIPIQSYENGKIAYLKTSPGGNIEYLDSLLTYCKTKKGIIIDLRGDSPFLHYPTFAKHLFPELHPWAILNIPDKTMPGAFKQDDKMPWSNWETQDNVDHYEGLIVALVDEYTQSYLEYFAMFLKQGRNTTIIGSQTAGADGNTERIYLPGGFKLIFTGIEVLWPNFEPTQRVGIKPDIYVAPTIRGVKEGKDIVIETAIKYISEKL